MSAEPASREERLDALWTAHAPAVVRYARRRVLNAEVDEVVAETFLVAWRRIDEVPGYALPAGIEIHWFPGDHDVQPRTRLAPVADVVAGFAATLVE